MINFEIKKPIIKDKEYLITEFGSFNSDPKNNQEVLQKAIDTVSSLGGGHLKLIPGVFELGPIELKSGVDLNIVRNCYLKFIKSPDFYKPMIFNYEGMEAIRCNSPVRIWNCENVSITGYGIIDGCGEEWRPCKDWKITIKDFESRIKKSPYYIEDKGTKILYPSKSSYEGALIGFDKIDIKDADKYYDLFRPVLISIYKSDCIMLKNITSSNSPAWNIHPLFSNNLTFDSIIVKNEYSAQNGDGIDVESCKNVEILNSTFEVGDDGICIKSGKNREARKIKVPCENIYIHDNLVYHAHGGIVIGSEMSRGIHNLYAINNTFAGTDVGLRFKSAMGRGGDISNLTFENTYMTDIKGEAIIIDLGYSLFKMAHEDKDKDVYVDDEDIPYFHDITINNLDVLSSKTFIKLNGINSDTIKNITVSNAKFNAQNFLDTKNFTNLHLKNVTNNKDINIVDESYNG